MPPLPHTFSWNGFYLINHRRNITLTYTGRTHPSLVRMQKAPSSR
jgi:hypothetical protein